MGLDEVESTLGAPRGRAAHTLVRRGALEVDVLEVVKIGLEERIPDTGRIAGLHALLHLNDVVVEPKKALVVVRLDMDGNAILLLNDTAVMGTILINGIEFTAANSTNPIITECCTRCDDRDNVILVDNKLELIKPRIRAIGRIMHPVKVAELGLTVHGLWI